MIGALRGTVLEWSGSGEVLVEVGGVGYRVLVPLGSLAVLQRGTTTVLFTHLHARDDTLVLYGFCSREERDTFEMVITSAGVGPKLGLALLSVHSPAALRRAVADDDTDALLLVPGVGKRTAARLCVELKERLGAPTPTAGTEGGAHAEVRAALVGLGFSQDEVRAALADVAADEASDASVEEMLRAALRQRAATRATASVPLEAPA